MLQPLTEEYSVAQHLFGLTDTDLSEIAMNSVKMSSFSDDIKASWHGAVSAYPHTLALSLYDCLFPSQSQHLPGVEGNDIHRTNVSNIRVLYREECLRRELNLISIATKHPVHQPTTPFTIPNPVANGTWRCDLDALQLLIDRVVK